MATIFCDKEFCIYNDGDNCYRDEIFLKDKKCVHYKVDFNCDQCVGNNSVYYPNCADPEVKDLEVVCNNFFNESDINDRVEAFKKISSNLIK